MTDAPSRAEANRRTYDDARLAAIYDVDNPAGEDHAFFRRVADEVSAARASTRIVDLGCGTGILTVTLAGPGRDLLFYTSYAAAGPPCFDPGWPR
ncbi:hypothetical protein NGH33_10025, partial [Micrococcus yunnanensis]|nr:hypothetical protein [Micrococcus yunnanensis]